MVLKTTSNQQLINNIIWNAIGLISPMGIAFLTIPRLIAQLGIVHFGMLTMIWMLISYTSILDLGLGRVITYQLSRPNRAQTERMTINLVWTSVVVLSLFGILAGWIFFLASPWLIYSFFHLSAVDARDCLHAFILLAFSFPVVIATNCARGVLESCQAFQIINVIRILMGLFIFIGPLIAWSWQHSLTAVTWFLVGSKVVNGILYFYFCYRAMPALFQSFSLDMFAVAASLRLGFWFTVSNVVNPLIGYLDRFFIVSVSLSALAYYVTPHEMATKLWLLPSCITAVMFPVFSSSLLTDKARAHLLFQQSIKVIFYLLFPCIFILIYFAHDLLFWWLGSEFAQQSERVLQWLSLGILVNAMAHIPATLIQANGKMKLTALISLIELPFYACALAMVAPHAKLEWIAMVWVARMAVDTLILVYFAHQIVPFSFATSTRRNMALLWLVLLFGLYPNQIMVTSGMILMTMIFLSAILPHVKSTLFKFVQLAKSQ